MNQQFSNRRFVVGGVFLLLGLLFLIRLFFLQVIDSSYRLSADNNVFRYVTQYPARGLIFDRNGELLVYNEVAYDLMAVPIMVESFDTLELCDILDVDVATLRKGLDEAKAYSVYKPSVIVKQISARKYAFLQEKLFKFPGFYVQTRTLRRYPEKIAAHLLGYVGEVDQRMIEKDRYYRSGDYVGISGIEKSYEAYLRGKKGVNIYLVDVHNRIKGSYKEGRFDTAAVVGSNIVTTLDADLQAYGERLMKNKVGSIVAIEPATGEILCLVTSPAYDPNLLVGRVRAANYRMLMNDSLNPLFNRAIMAKYPPGSTFKLVNALVGLQEKVITTNSVFSCAGGYHVGSFTVGCHHGGSIDFIRSISGSCNAYYCNVYQRILDDRKYGSVGVAYENWRKHLASFGVGVYLGTDLTTELRGNVPPREHFDKIYGKDKWKSLWVISMAIGQGELGVTPIQLANVTSAIANRGYYYIPHAVKEIKGDGVIDPRFREKRYTSVDTAYFRPVIEGMELVVKSGTAASAYIPSVAICGKTGTAENPHGEDHSIFTSFAPKDQPRIVVTVYVENAGFGSTYAAPIASLMIEKYLTDSVTRPWLEERIVQTNLLPKVVTKKTN